MAKSLLSDREAKAAKPKAKPYRLPDGDNLYLYVATTGIKSWQSRYRNLKGKSDTFTIGKYPRISLEAARAKHAGVQADCDAGRDPKQSVLMSKLAALAKSATTFEKVAADWIEDEAKYKKWSADYKTEVVSSLQNHLRGLNPVPISSINATLRKDVLRAVERKAPQMVDKIDRRLHGVLDHAVEAGLIPTNPLTRRRPRVDRKHYPAVTELEGIGAILRAARAADPCKGVMRAHILLAFTSQRVGEIVGAEWTEFDFDHAQWPIPRNRMKRKDPERGPHFVPVPNALLSLLREWRAADGPDARYVCVAPRDSDAPITPEAIEKFYRNALSLAGKHSPHSWRSAFSTIGRDAGKSGEAIESQLDHVVGNKIQSAYDRAQRLELRRTLMQWYEDSLIAARDGATVTPIRSRK